MAVRPSVSSLAELNKTKDIARLPEAFSKSGSTTKLPLKNIACLPQLSGKERLRSFYLELQKSSKFGFPSQF